MGHITQLTVNTREKDLRVSRFSMYVVIPSFFLDYSRKLNLIDTFGSFHIWLLLLLLLFLLSPSAFGFLPRNKAHPAVLPPQLVRRWWYRLMMIRLRLCLCASCRTRFRPRLPHQPFLLRAYKAGAGASAGYRAVTLESENPKDELEVELAFAIAFGWV